MVVTCVTLERFYFELVISTNGAAVGVFGTGIGAELPTSASTLSAKTLLATALENAVDQSCVHEVVVSKTSANTLNLDNDICSHEGRQLITISGSAKSEVISFVSLKTAYVEGNELGLKNYFGFPASYSKEYAGKWMKSVPSDQGWTAITTSTTLKSDFSSDPKISSPTLGKKLVTVDGKRAYSISGTVPASASSPSALVNWYIADSAKPLPLQITVTAKGIETIVSWTKWGESPKIDAPSTFVPFP